MQFSHTMPEIPPETRAVKFPDPDKVDLSTLNCHDFVEWLRAKKFSTEHCRAFKGMQLYNSFKCTSYFCLFYMLE